MDPFDFSDSCGIVVGGATGLGYEIARSLAERGAAVIVASRNRDRLSKAAESLQTLQHRCSFVEVDVTSEESVRKLFSHAADLAPRGLNFVVNSSGTNKRGRIETVELSDWQTILTTNLTGAYLLSRFALPLLRQASWARLVHITSIFSSVSYPERISYASAKGGLLQLVRTLALEWAQFGITVNGLSPGPFLTEINEPLLKNPEAYKDFCQNIPLGRFGNPAEIIPAALFLLSPLSTYVTGLDLVIDGGWTAK